MSPERVTPFLWSGMHHFSGQDPYPSGMLGFIVVSVQRRDHNATCDMDWGRSIHVPGFLFFGEVLVSFFDNGIMYCMTTPSMSKFG